MRIVYLGNFRQPHCTEVHLVSGLIDEHRPRLFLQTRTWSWPSTRWVLPVMDRCRELGIVTAGFHLDRLFGLHREERILGEPMFQSDVVFTADGDDPQKWSAVIPGAHVWLRAGVAEEECRRVDANPRLYGGKLVAFVGTEHYHAEWPQRARLVGHLRDKWGDRFLKVGDGNPTIRGLELNELYASVPVIVGDSCFARPDALYWSDRPYETWGRGGCLVFPTIEALGAEVGLYPAWEDVDDHDALDEVIHYLLDVGPERDRYASDLHFRVRSNCTYRHRAQEMLARLGLDQEATG